MPDQFLIGILFGFIVSLASYYARFLDLSGAVATFILAVIVFGIGGWPWTGPIMAFFVSSSLLSRYGRSRKRQFDAAFEKSSTRDWGQVAANGGIAGVLVIVSAAFPVHDFYPLYLGAIAAVTADTWGTEIGLLTKGKTVSILTLRPVDKGTSGGVSEAGVIGGLSGAGLIALLGSFWYPDFLTAIVVVAAGGIGSTADSILGATLQAQYECVVCGKGTERRQHCAEPARLARGIAWVNNDVVNVVCAAAGAAVAWALMII
ncbi:MAG: DUF92 domain-containing protein [Ignavibacteria bacterium]|nr:DUF92 domain-containing protein [Ignavibacteria bacterium]